MMTREPRSSTDILNQEDREVFDHHRKRLQAVYAGWWILVRNRRVVDADRDLHLLSVRNSSGRGYLGFVDGLPVADEATVQKALGR